jgi:hypothetical protein
VIRAEVAVLPENDNNALAVQVRQARERLGEKFRAQAEQLQKLEQDLKELRDEHEQLESEAWHQFEALEKSRLPSAPVPVDAVLAAVRNLLTATLPKQVFNKLTEEACRMGVRAVAFEVRGKAAWGASAHGFGPQLTEQGLRSLVVPLSVDTPFRQAFEIGGHFEGNPDALKKNANVLNRLQPDSGDSILLLPIRSAGAVSAIFYADSGGRGALLPEAGLELLAEFAGAQLDRLRALSGRASATVSQDANGEAEPESGPGLASPAGAAEPPAEVAELSEASASRGETSAPSIDEPLPPAPASPLIEAGAPVVPPPTEAQAELPAARATIGFVPAPGPVPVLVMEAQTAVGVPPAPTPRAGFDVSQLSEAEQKIHKDAKRFARLLVFEIELYNKAKVAEGRKSKDLYRRMKLDIDRSRQTFEQRFGKTVGKQFDYFHDELVRTLAGNDPSLLGSGYPGPSCETPFQNPG